MRDVGEREKLNLWLHYATESNTRLWRQFSLRFSELSEAWKLAAGKRDSAFDFMPEFQRKRLFQAADEGFMARYIAWLERHRVDVCMPMHEDYPSLLKEIHDPPSVLFVRGRLTADMGLPIALVGTRSPTDYGKTVARGLGNDFARAGAVVISGMASGVDSYAARGALDCAEAAYPTVAVLGSGIDVVYPSENRRLYEEIAERGAVITEYLPGAEPKREHFPVRNRIISGLSRGVVVVEAGERSGTSITAGLAHDQGREVFAVPGRITDPMSAGTNRMIGAGEAKPVFSAADVLGEFDYLSDYDSFYSGVQRIPFSTLSEEEAAVYRMLKTGEKSIDELCELLPYSAGLINSVLTAMQFSGIMKQLPGRLYMLDTARTLVCED